MSGIRRIVFFLLVFLSISEIFSQNYDYRDADKLFGKEKWAEAADVYLVLAEQNPYQGYFWDNYAYCLYMQKDYNKAIQYFKKAIDVGYRVPECMYNIACCYSLMNNPEEAVKWIELSADYKYRNLEQGIINDGDFNTVRNTALFKKEIMPSKDMFKNRAEGWEADIKFMKKRMEQTHYNLFANINKNEWDMNFESLLNKVADLDDSQIYTGLLKITSKVGDGHTTIWLPANDNFKGRVLPVQFNLFEEGLFVTFVSPEYKELAGKKVIKIGNSNTEDVLKLLSEVTSFDNEFSLKSFSMQQLTVADILYGLGITENNKEVEITIEGNQKTVVKSVIPTEDYFHGPNVRKDLVRGRDTANSPLYLKNRTDIYWYEYIPEKKMVFMQYNSIVSKEDEPLNDFLKKMFEFINGNDVNYFVLDIRFNGGGNSFLNKYLVQSVIKCEKINQKGKFFTIIGRSTFSAAQNLTNDLERQTNIIFAGEPTGSKPNFVGETNVILLPYSGLRVSCSSRYWQSYLSDDYRKWVAPQLGVKYYFEDYKNGIDPAMDAIMKFINK